MPVIQGLLYNLHILEAMANNRKDGIDKVNDLLTPIIEHLVKIAIYNYSKDREVQVKGWENEVLNWLEQIDDYCNSLKDNKRLKFKDYMLCLNDDLGRDDIVRRKVNIITRRYKHCYDVENFTELRQTLWQILEAQFKVMSVDVWCEQTLKENENYKLLYSNKYFI